MALYTHHSIFHLARLLYVRPETFGPYYVYSYQRHTAQVNISGLHSARKELFLNRKLDVNLKKKVVNRYIWSTALYGVTTLTVQKILCKI